MSARRGRTTSVAVRAERISVDSFSKDDIMVAPSILSANFAKLGEQVRHHRPCKAPAACGAALRSPWCLPLASACA